MAKSLVRSLRVVLPLVAILCATPAEARVRHCSIRPVNYRGWNAQEVRNDWVTLTLVPQLGGRLMQVAFGPHEYLFVNKRYEGKYLPPIAPDAPAAWYNYGGDKIWPLPEGKKDDKQWPGPVSDVLDDGEYAFTVLSQAAECKVRMAGPPDARTGLQYSREITLSSDSPKISFHAVMRNASARTIEWSMQSVTQYNTADASGKANTNIWAFAAANERSSFPAGYFVRSGSVPAGLHIRNGLVTLNYSSLESELWFDTEGGWLAIADSTTQYAMVERFRVEDGQEYPGKATIIFYTNDGNGPTEDAFYYMEAEINSPMVRLQPGETYAMDTEWYSTRTGSAFLGVTDGGVIAEHLRVSNGPEKERLTGAFGVFLSGRLVAKFLDKNRKRISEIELREVNPQEFVALNERISLPRGTSRVEVHLIDLQGRQCGVLDEVSVAPGGGA